MYALQLVNYQHSQKLPPFETLSHSHLALSWLDGLLSTAGVPSQIQVPSRRQLDGRDEKTGLQAHVQPEGGRLFPTGAEDEAEAEAEDEEDRLELALRQ